MRFENFRPSPFFTAALSLAVATSLSLASPARAERDDGGDRDDDRRDRDRTQIHIALDMDYVGAIAEPDTASGGGGALRIGPELDLFLVSLRPELGGSYHSFSGDADTRVYAGFAGGRLALGKIIEPSIFAHVGVGRMEGAETRTAPLMDLGVALDLTVLPLIDIGAHGAYNVVFPRDDGSSFKWLTLGAHAALVL